MDDLALSTSYFAGRRLAPAAMAAAVRGFGLDRVELGYLTRETEAEAWEAAVAADEAEIPLICTAEMYRRCGRGAKILEDLLSIAREKGAERVFLEVRVSNAPAMSMYLKYGFCGAYARLRYYPDGEDALVMRKELD